MQEKKEKDPYVLIVDIRETLLRHLLFIEGFRYYLKKYLGASIRETLHLASGKECQLYYRLSSIKNIVKTLKRKIRDNYKFGEKIYNQAIDKCRGLIEVSQRISKESTESLTNQELVKRWRVIRQAFIEWSPFLAIPNPYEKLIEGELKKEIFKGNFNQDEWQKLTFLERKPAILQENLELLGLALEKKIGRDISARFKEHVKRYKWLSCYNPDDKPLSKRSFQKRLDQLLQLDKITLQNHYQRAKNSISKDKREYSKLIKRLKLSRETLRNLEFLRKLIFLKSYRMESAMQAFCLLRRFFKEISKRLGLGLRQLVELTPSEVEEYLEKGTRVRKSLFKDRKRQAVLKKGEKVYFYFGKEADYYFSLVNQGNRTKDTRREIKGNPVSAGIVKGRVRIVGKENINQFKRGEILVAKMTTPDYLPAMMKAKAIVTNEGGITSHAAIVSRELKIPCVVGTKEATRVLKDGDIILVDATKGIIKKLNPGG